MSTVHFCEDGTTPHIHFKCKMKGGGGVGGDDVLNKHHPREDTQKPARSWKESGSAAGGQARQGGPCG